MSWLDIIRRATKLGAAATFLLTGVSVQAATPSRITDLGDLPGGSGVQPGPPADYGQARGVNDAGQVVGFREASTGFRAFRWTARGVIRSISERFVACVQGVQLRTRGQPDAAAKRDDQERQKQVGMPENIRLAPDELRALVGAMIMMIIKITIGTNKVVILVSKEALHARLLAGRLPCIADSASPATPGFEDDRIQLTVEGRPQRCGREVRLIVTPAEGTSMPSRESPAHEGAGAGARVAQSIAAWRRALDRKVGWDERYVSQVVHCAFVAPD